MKFTELDIANFLTIGEASVSLDDRGLILIQGENKDDPSAKSNGAGKSSIVDALCWALYGVTARGVSGDAVVNKTSKKNCRVRIVLEEGKYRYCVTRYRKHSTEKNQLFLSIQDASGITDMSKGTDKETQELVNKALGCSLEVFMAAVYCGQESMPDLPGMTDKMLKTLIEEAAGIGELTEAYAIARSRYGVAKSALDMVTAATVADLDAIEKQQTDLDNITASADTFDATRKDRAKDELAKVLPVNAEIGVLKAAMASDSDISEELATLQAKLDAQKVEQANSDALAAVAVKFGRAAVTAKAELDAALLAIKKADAALKAVDDQVGKSCTECGKTYHADDLCDVVGMREDDAKRLRRDAAPLVGKHKGALENEKDALEVAMLVKATLTDVSAVAARMKVLRDLERAAMQRKMKITELESAIQRHKDAAKVRLTEANPWTKAKEGKAKDIEARKVLYDGRAAKQKLHIEEVKLLTDAVSVFGPAGVRAHILDTVTPYLNEKTKDYLGALSDGNIHAVWSTLSTTAKGELKEKFNIEVTNDMGAESFAGMSGGEKRKVRLATSMALQDMVASRATKPIQLWIGDEIDHALDDSGLERLMGILERKARERGTVLVISHNSLADWIDNVITVSKSEGIATVSGATHGS